MRDTDNNLRRWRIVQRSMLMGQFDAGPRARLDVSSAPTVGDDPPRRVFRPQPTARAHLVRTGRIRGLLIVLAALAVLSFPPMLWRSGGAVPRRARSAFGLSTKRRSSARTGDPRRIAVCESTSRWSLNSGNGFYGGFGSRPVRGARSAGRGFAHISMANFEQMYRALGCSACRGWGAWPVCRHSAGV